MFSFAKHTRSPIGVDIGTRKMKAVQLDAAGTRIVAAAAISRSETTSIPSPDEVTRLCGMLDRAGFRGNRIVLAVPPDKMLSDVLEFPRVAGSSLEKMARLELARTHRCTPDSLELGVWELPVSTRASKSMHVMVAACRHDDVNPLLDVFESQRLDVVALDARPAALARAALPLAAEEKAVTAILDFGWNSATLTLMHKQTVFYERKIQESGLGRLHREFCQRMQVEVEVADYLLDEVGLNPQQDKGAPTEARALLVGFLDALTAELLASFNYASHEYNEAPLGCLLLAGGGASVSRVYHAPGKCLRRFCANRRPGRSDAMPGGTRRTVRFAKHVAGVGAGPISPASQNPGRGLSRVTMAPVNLIPAFRRAASAADSICAAAPRAALRFFVPRRA